ncbi:MAG: AAA family ATPase [Cellvibrionales bacterium]|nr:AAA family ATPase [Cellvibrionales bacterium]
MQTTKQQQSLPGKSLPGNKRVERGFPFAAIIGQPLLKKALMLLAIDPKIQGVLLSGPRGIAKSTTVRAFFEVLPECSASRFVNLPIGTTEDRLVGSLHLEKVLNDKQVSFQEGLLANAHQGILYADEVNLLSDHLVDNLLDVAASGVNFIERDGLSHSHPSQFMLVGTMNPDEGELRPQLLDRFGFMVAMQSQFSIDERIAIVERRTAFDHDPEAFCHLYADEQAAITQRILNAKNQLAEVDLPLTIKRQIATLCAEANCEGLRADIVFHRAVVAHAALAGRYQVGEEDIAAVKDLVLVHRQKPKPPEKKEPPSTPNEPAKFKRPLSNASTNDESESEQTQGDYGALAPLQPVKVADDKLFTPDLLASPVLPQQKNSLSDEKSLASRPMKNDRIDWFSSLIQSKGNLAYHHLRWKFPKQKTKQGHCIVLDTSGSTLKHSQLPLAKKLVLELNHSIYLLRHQMALVCFGNGDTQLMKPLARASKDCLIDVESIESGGGTPFMQMIAQLSEWLTAWVMKKDYHITCHLITDGRMQVDVSNLMRADLPCEWKLYDMDLATIKRGKLKSIATHLDAEYFHIEELMA